MARRTRRQLRRSRALRADMTLAEVCLWEELRREALGVRFRRQHPIGPYIADFACVPKLLVVEVDGITHDTPERNRADTVRDGWMATRGWTVLRFNDEHVLRDVDNVIDDISRHL